MTTTMTNVSAVAEDLEAKLEAIRRDMEALVQRRDSLMLTTRAELHAAGIPCHIVSKGWKHEVGGQGYLVESYFDTSWGDRAHQLNLMTSEDYRDVGPYTRGDSLHNVHGLYEILFIDGDKMLVAETEDQGDTEAPHRKAVARLRTLAASHGMRVSVRDREVGLIDPMNRRPHAGDVLSAFKWLTGHHDTPQNAD